MTIGSDRARSPVLGFIFQQIPSQRLPITSPISHLHTLFGSDCIEAIESYPISENLRLIGNVRKFFRANVNLELLLKRAILVLRLQKLSNDRQAIDFLTEAQPIYGILCQFVVSETSCPFCLNVEIKFYLD